MIHNPELEHLFPHPSAEGLFAATFLREQLPPNRPTLYLRTSLGKADWQRRLLSTTGLPIEVKDAEWDEDLRRKAMSSPEVARKKAESQSTPGISLATDVMVSCRDGFFGKPKEKTIDAIRIFLKQQLGEHSENTFTVLTGVAVGSYNEDKQRNTGKYTQSIHRLTVSRLTTDEIDTYLQHFTLEELHKVNGGLYWPFSPLIDHIVSVDGVKKGEDNFHQKQQELFRSLLGAPIELLALTQQVLHDSTQPADTQSPRNDWEQVFYLSDRTLATINSVIPSCTQEISVMVQANFLNSPNYMQLRDEDPESFKGFLDANSPVGIWQTCQNLDNICSLSVQDSKGVIIGYAVVRKTINHDGKIVADIKRFHVGRNATGKGAGKHLLSTCESIAIDAGCNKIIVGASGSSHKFFVSQGFSEDINDQPQMKFHGTSSNVPLLYLEKNL